MTTENEYSFARMKAANGNATADADYLTWFLQETRIKIRTAVEQAEKVFDLADWDLVTAPDGVARINDADAFLHAMGVNLSDLVKHFANSPQIKETFNGVLQDTRVAKTRIETLRRTYSFPL